MSTSDRERVAQLEKVLSRGLALLAAGRADEARRQLEAALVSKGQPTAFASELSEQELESAFAAAEPVADEMVDADRVAREAILEADAELGLGQLRPGSAFATRTMAELLERQGDSEGASRIRAALAGRAGSEPGRPGTEQLVAVLEGWLTNLRRRKRA